MATHEPGDGPRDPRDPGTPPPSGESRSDSRDSGSGTGDNSSGSGGHEDIGGADPTVRFPTSPPGPPPAPGSGGPADDPTVRFGEPAPQIPGLPPIVGSDAPGTPDVSGTPEPTPRKRGSIQSQEAGVTQPRPPTVAEARARDKARRRAEEAERAAAEAQEHKDRTRRKMLIGGVAVAGIAAVVGAGYLAYQAASKPDVTAYCVVEKDGQETVAPDDQCVRAQNQSSGYGGMPGIFILGGSQYHYYYGGNNTVGQPPTGGSTVAPKNANVKTKSGTVIRGGLGSKSGTSGGS
ncbi:hypothetical protein [Nocardia vermiculata]|uniref:hypothetical protein n=1 Tax=Nocardia vermiculata TaxID=257274 RepID=UPI000A7BC593|nr:hypothetical protein [Nocardia vermiculata]